jgi:hypothetical protein
LAVRGQALPPNIHCKEELLSPLLSCGCVVLASQGSANYTTLVGVGGRTQLPLAAITDSNICVYMYTTRVRKHERGGRKGGGKRANGSLIARVLSPAGKGLLIPS